LIAFAKELVAGATVFEKSELTTRSLFSLY